MQLNKQTSGTPIFLLQNHLQPYHPQQTARRGRPGGHPRNNDIARAHLVLLRLLRQHKSYYHRLPSHLQVQPVLP